jgi:hypothetical protein
LELIVVGVAMLTILLLAKDESSKNVRELEKENLDDDTIYG